MLSAGPPGYDPDAFDPGEATDAMRLWASGEHLPWHALPEPLADLVKALAGEGWVQATEWLAVMRPRMAVALDEDDVGLASRPWPGGVGCRRVGCEAHGRRVPCPRRS